MRLNKYNFYSERRSLGHCVVKKYWKSVYINYFAKFDIYILWNTITIKLRYKIKYSVTVQYYNDPDYSGHAFQNVFWLTILSRTHTHIAAKYICTTIIMDQTARQNYDSINARFAAGLVHTGCPIILLYGQRNGAERSGRDTHFY